MGAGTHLLLRLQRCASNTCRLREPLLGATSRLQEVKQRNRGRHPPPPPQPLVDGRRLGQDRLRIVPAPPLDLEAFRFCAYQGPGVGMGIVLGPPLGLGSKGAGGGGGANPELTGTEITNSPNQGFGVWKNGANGGNGGKWGGMGGNGKMAGIA